MTETFQGIFSGIENAVDIYYSKRLNLFKKLVGERVVDGFLHFPLHSIEKIYVKCLDEEYLNKIISINLIVEFVELPGRKSKQPAKICARSGCDFIEILLFNSKSQYIAKSQRVGSQILVTGKLTKSLSGVFQIIHPEKISKILMTKVPSGFFNIYPLTSGLDQQAVSHLVKNSCKILEKCDIQDWLDDDFLAANNWPDFQNAIKIIHNPLEKIVRPLETTARQRICFDEILAEQIGLKLSRGRGESGILISNQKLLVKKFMELLPFELTKSQKIAIGEIDFDLASGFVMTRLLQGDVGSGKTVVAIMSALNVIESGYQVAVLVPTEILARQHHQTITKYFEKMGLVAEILTSSEKGLARKNTLKNVKSGVVNILVGTHAIITDQVEFGNLGFVVVDEQHKFGVSQRLELINKGKSPHILSMTATPIPRTMILSIYGDIAVSSLKEKPSGRKEIVTKVISISRLSEVVSSLKNIIKNNEKVYWVCPLIEEGKNVDYSCVVDRLKHLKQHFGEDVLMLHGKMKASEKGDVFQEFSQGVGKILVATTVVEVGVDVPDATVMIIENAEKFGLAQLHQLRGRIGRSEKQSYCLLLHEEKMSKIACQRINIMKNSNDGFCIAEQDLLLRGGGEVIGTRQSGIKNYRTFDFADPDSQKIVYDLFSKAAALASEVVAQNKIAKYETMLKIFAKDGIGNFIKSF